VKCKLAELGKAEVKGEPHLLSWLGFYRRCTVYFGWRVYNAERVPLKGPVILASNHASFLDRLWSAPAEAGHQLSRARKSVPVSGDGWVCGSGIPCRWIATAAARLA